MRPPKFIPTCDSILIPNVASTLQWKRRRIRRVAWYAEDNFNVNPTSSLSCHVSCADFFRRRALFLPLTRRPCFLRRGTLPHGGVCCMVQRWNVCAIVFWRVVWYRAGTFLCMRSWPRRGCGCVVPWTSWPSCRGRGVPGCGCGVVWPWLWRPPSFCRRRVVATRR